MNSYSFRSGALTENFTLSTPASTTARIRSGVASEPLEVR